ncbi:hypothetical protein IMZ48_16955 [Candidatus Bathyarchaeota archaeon]|nr:hypothetical protein [Candidatus Bathyarchaeota archaeon]
MLIYKGEISSQEQTRSIKGSKNVCGHEILRWENESYSPAGGIQRIQERRYPGYRILATKTKRLPCAIDTPSLQTS